MGFSTEIGFVNDNGQENLGPTALEGTDHGQRVYALRCQTCAREYGANGSDVHLRRCPACGGGRPGFEVAAADVIELPVRPAVARNPNWTRDELILALDVYMDLPSPDQHHPAVKALSALLNQLWIGTRHAGGASLRNPSGVSMKLSNFQRFDPRFQDRGLKGLPNGAKADEVVWNEFAGDRPRLRQLAEAIRAVIASNPAMATMPDLNSDIEAPEGAVLTRMHHYRERDASLARKKKERVLARDGKLVCEACDFDFQAAYGERGAGFIEVHHTQPLETLKPGHRTKLDDLALLCANCHRMVHAKRPWLSMHELRRLMVRDPREGECSVA